jgi:hypothetical protein
MRVGALAMFDALGFKGIWSRPGIRENPELVISKLRDLESRVSAFLDRDFGGNRNDAVKNPLNVLGQCSVSFLSDTVVLGVATKTPEELEPHSIREENYRGWSLTVAARFANFILREAAKSEPSLAYRGCISYGEFALENNFIVGRAVDAAAEAMDRAQGAFVWFAPEAMTELSRLGLELSTLREQAVVPYSVPLKGGDQYETGVVAPFGPTDSRSERAAIVESILKTFAGSLDVVVKKQRTRHYFNFALDYFDGMPT